MNLRGWRTLSVILEKIQRTYTLKIYLRPNKIIEGVIEYDLHNIDRILSTDPQSQTVSLSTA